METFAIRRAPLGESPQSPAIFAAPTAWQTPDGSMSIVEAETRLDDVQAAVRGLRSKQRDLGSEAGDPSRRQHSPQPYLLDQVPDLRREFPIHTRLCLAALGRGEDTGGDCLVIL